MDPRPWSGETLKKLSKHLRDGTTPPDTLPSYDDVMVWYDELVDHVIREIDSIPWERALGDRYRKPIGRAKTVQTLCEKLQRMPSTHLPHIQDVAGVRLELPVTLTEQDSIARAVCNHFGQDPSCIVDLRKTPHAGYRAVHVLLNLPDLRGRAEVQIRTTLQGEWANMYEELADLIGREIRYKTLEEGDTRRPMIDKLHELSCDTITSIEELKNQLYLLRFRQEQMAEKPLDEELAAVLDQYDIPALQEAIAKQEAALVEAIQSIKAELRNIATEKS